MKKVLTSFGTGYHSRLLSLAIPTFYRYANLHNYDMFLPNNTFFSNTTKELPPSWWKLDLIEYLLNIYDQVLWLDADVIICKFDEDISDTMNNNYDFGAVVHETPDGIVPNCGVWLLNQSSLRWISQLKLHNSFKRSQCWWEQASLIHLLGANPDDTPVVLPDKYTIPWFKLDYLWNPHLHDHRKIPDQTKFFHATCFNNRYEAIKTVLESIEF